MSRIDINGELSIFTAAEFCQKLLSALDAEAHIEVDLSKVNEMDCAGIQLLVAAKREAEVRNKILHFTAYSSVALDVLEQCNLFGFLEASVPVALKIREMP